MDELQLTRLRSTIAELHTLTRVSRLMKATAKIRFAAACESMGASETRGKRGLDVAVDVAIAGIKKVVRARQLQTRIPAVANELRGLYKKKWERERPAWKRLADGFESSGLPIPALSIGGYGTAEVRFTKLLRYLLDPKSPHGLGTRPLSVLFGGDVASVDAVVQAEVCLGTVNHGDRNFDSAIDIVIQSGGRTIFIEQKILAAESREGTGDDSLSQLTRYNRAIEASGSWGTACGKYFLTPTGKGARDDATDWVKVTHASWIEKLATLLGDTSLTTMARFNLLTLLWELLVGPLAMDDRLEWLAAHGRLILANPYRFSPLRRHATRVFPSVHLLLQVAGELP